jgi:hypothetical protein
MWLHKHIQKKDAGFGILFLSRLFAFGMVRSFPLRALAFLRGGGQASSCLRGLARPPIPLESSALRFNPLCALGVVSGLRMVVIKVVSSSFAAVV